MNPNQDITILPLELLIPLGRRPHLVEKRTVLCRYRSEHRSINPKAETTCLAIRPENWLHRTL